MIFQSSAAGPSLKNHQFYREKKMNYPLLDKYPLPFLPLIRAAAARGSSSSLLYFIDSSSSGWWLLCRCGCCWLTTFLDFEHDSPQTIENEMPIYLSMLVHANRGIIIFYPNYVWYYNFVQNMKSLS